MHCFVLGNYLLSISKSWLNVVITPQMQQHPNGSYGDHHPLVKVTICIFICDFV